MNHNRNRRAVVEQYAKLAPEYDARWSSYIRATTDATLDRLMHPLGDTLDVGCGTGAMLSRLCNDFPDANLTGIDASSEMLEIAHDRLSHGVALRECWVEDLPFDDSSFDTVLSCNMFHFIRNPNAALDEMLRVLRPNGIMVITDWCDDYFTCKLFDIYLRWSDPAHFRIYGVSGCRKLLQAADARQIVIEKFKITFLWGLMTATARKHSDSNVAAR